MTRSMSLGTPGSRRRSRALAAIVAGGLFFVACGGDDGDSTPAETEAPATSEAPSSDAPMTSDAPGTDAPVSEDGPPTGPEMLIGMVNTEGNPNGLDFPDLRRFAEAAFEYMNSSGGFGGRPVKFETCVAGGTPETSQKCAQELIGKGVELVLLGLDLFPDYATYGAANIPVIGVLPILPPDNTAEALFLTGGNATTTAVMAVIAQDRYQAKTVGMIHADNAGANSTAAGVQAALDKAGIKWKAVKGGDNETDAGYLGLMKAADADDPDILISLYADAGCIGTIRGYATAGITKPVLTTSICSDSDVISQVGDDANGWVFVGGQIERDTPEKALLQKILAPYIPNEETGEMGVEPADVKTTALGLGGLGTVLTLTLRDIAAQMVAEGTEMTGQNLYDYLKVTDGLYLFGGITPLDCGAAAPTYSSFCSFVFEATEYKDGAVVSVENGKLWDSIPLLP
ncbi:MAG: ABC transporter substrate-binding protein [Actinomycetota bacterium]|nr:ABC transporter substrate-binding protein [Actinomycetota bacterium]